MTDKIDKALLYGNRFVVNGQEVDVHSISVNLTSDDLTEYTIPLEASPAAVFAWEALALARELEFLYGNGTGGAPFGLLGGPIAYCRPEDSRDFLADMIRIRHEERFARALASPIAINVGILP